MLPSIIIFSSETLVLLYIFILIIDIIYYSIFLTSKNSFPFLSTVILLPFLFSFFLGNFYYETISNYQLLFILSPLFIFPYLINNKILTNHTYSDIFHNVIILNLIYILSFFLTSTDNLIYIYIILEMLVIMFVTYCSKNNIYNIYQTFKGIKFYNSNLNSSIIYLLISMLSSIFILLSILLLINTFLVFDIYSIELLLKFKSNSNLYIVEYSIYLIILATIIKAGVFPFFFWSIVFINSLDIKKIILFSSIMKINVIYLIFTISSIIFYLDNLDFYIYLFLVLALLNIFISSFLGLKSNTIKMFMLCSFINNFGFLLVTFTLSIENYRNNFLSLNYFLSYLFLSLCLLYCIKLVTNFFSINLKQLKYFLNNNNYILFIFIFILLNFSGLPPFLFFYLKYQMFELILHFTGFNYIIILSILIVNLLTMSFYLRIVKILL